MLLYHYAAKGNTVSTDGILSFARNPNANLGYYFKRSGETTHAGIVKWLESTFAGCSRGIRGFSAPVQPTEKSPSLQSFIDNADLFAIDIDALNADGLIDAVYVSPPVTDVPDITDAPDADEPLYRLSGIRAIDASPIDWSVCDDSLGRRFAYVRYYLLVVADGVIPPEYIEKYG